MPSITSIVVDGPYEYPHATITTTDMIIFAVFLSFWFALYYQAVLSPQTGTPHGYASAFISNLHCIPLVALAMASLAELIPESIPMAFSSSFFVVDLVDCLVRKDFMFGAHAVITLALNVGAGRSDVHRRLRSTSKGLLAEASTPFLNHWKKSKTKTDYLIFFLSFTLCRIIWFPFFLYTTYAVHMKGQMDFVLCPICAFMVLQYGWYFKMCGIALNYKVPGKLNGVSGGGVDIAKNEAGRMRQSRIGKGRSKKEE